MSFQFSINRAFILLARKLVKSTKLLFPSPLVVVWLSKRMDKKRAHNHILSERV